MKTLLLLRHAKSSWEDADLKDFDRPLNERGLKTAPLIGRELKRRKLQPELILSSPAKRARQTTELVIQAAKLKAKVQFDERIYEASARRLFEIVAAIKPSVNLALLVGHNPGFEELTKVLTSQNTRLRTASLVCIELNLEKWGSVRPGVGELKWIVDPKSVSE